MSDYADSEEEENEQELYLGEYEGERNELGERHGEGRAVLPNGDVYQGDYFNGLRHGLGAYIFKKGGSRYLGSYDNNMKHGRGTFSYPDGSRYEGMWVSNERNGQGTYTFANGDTYVGEWRKNKKHGNGVYTCASTKVKLQGNWIAGKLNGKGEIVIGDHTYEGQFKDNLPFGMGKYVFEKGFEQSGFYDIIEQKEDEFDEEEEPVKTLVWKCLSLSAAPPK